MKWMDEREVIIALEKAILKNRREVRSSKAAARKHLIRLGILTPKGNLKKVFRSSSNVPR